VLLGAGLGAAPGSAANLVEVRVGRHAEFTRVVLEMDAPTRYELTGQGEGELRVRLFANASPRRLGSKSNVLREVVVESDAAGAVARLALAKSASVDVKQMVLDNPPRIVLDLIPRTALARAPVTVTAKKGPAPAIAKAEPAPAPPAPAAEAPAPPAAEPEPAAAPEAERQEPAGPPPPVAEAKPAAAPAPLAAPDAAAEETEEAPGDEAAERAARDAAAQAELDRLAGVPSMTEPPPQAAPAPAEAAPGSESAAGAGGAAEGDEDAAGLEEGEGYEAEAAEAAEVAAMPAHPRAPAPGPLGFLPQPFDDPLVLGVVVVLLGLIGALVVLRQRAARSAEAEASANPFAAAEAFALAGAGAPGASREAGEAWASAAAPPDQALGPLFANAAERGAEAAPASIFDVAEEDAGRYEECTPPASALVVVDSEEATPGVAGAEALEENVMRVVEELERRIAHLETRLEEVADAKERLERHVAAQTEELRVQRAAIARTQRVLRTIAKPEDLATEPVPKV
jgi:hypothetical protein